MNDYTFFSTQRDTREKAMLKSWNAHLGFPFTSVTHKSIRYENGTNELQVRAPSLCASHAHDVVQQRCHRKRYLRKRGFDNRVFKSYYVCTTINYHPTRLGCHSMDSITYFHRQQQRHERARLIFREGSGRRIRLCHGQAQLARASRLTREWHFHPSLAHVRQHVLSFTENPLMQGKNK